MVIYRLIIAYTMPQLDTILQELRRGKIIIVTDDKTRENEGDFVLAAEFATPQKINFLITHGRGLVCLPLSQELAAKLKLPLMAKKNTSRFHTNFTISVEAARGTTTGISAHDRATTILAAANPKAKPRDLVRPGHIFPLIAHPKGVLGRRGQTEATIDLLQLAGLTQAGVLCEILASSGRAMKGIELLKFAKKFKLKIISVADIAKYIKNQS